MKKKLVLIFGLVFFILLTTSYFANAYSKTNGIEPGDIVDLEYDGQFEDGTTFDAGRIKTADISPGQFIVGFYEGILGMKSGETKKIVVQPKDGYTDPSHQLYNKVLIFAVHIWSIVKDSTPDQSFTSGALSTIWKILKPILIIAGIILIIYTLNSLKVKTTAPSCAHCQELGRSTAAEGKCGKCGNTYCRASFSKGCPNCHANSFVPFSN